MTDFKLLYLVLALIYLSDCLFWVRRGSIVLRGWFTGRCAVAHPSSGFGSTSAGIVPLNPLPPFGNAYVCDQWPLSLTEDAAYSYVATVPNHHERPEQLACCVRFDDIRTVTRDGAMVLVNDRAFAKLNSEMSAIHFSRLLVRLARMPAVDRNRAIDAALSQSMNPDAIRRRLARFRLHASPLRLQAHLIAVVLFGAVPFTIAVVRYRRFLLPSLILLAGFLLIQSVTFVIAHRRLFRRGGASRYRTAFTMIFTPPAAIRAAGCIEQRFIFCF